MKQIVVADIGGTHARFALAEVAGNRVVALGQETIFRASDHTDLPAAWAAFAGNLTLPRDAAIAVAGPVGGEVLALTNSPWTIRPATLAATLGVDRVLLLNDFAAVGHAVAHLGPHAFAHLCGPDRPMPAIGAISVIGPGTGLGVAIVIRNAAGTQVIATEGGHIDFAPLDAFEDALLARLRLRHGRVSVERVVAGSGLAAIHATLATSADRGVVQRGDTELWAAALAGEDDLAAAALDRYCLSLGAVAGDLALAHGAAGVVIAGGLGLRLAAHLPRSGFQRRFIAKGRYADAMAAIPVRLLTHPQPGLYGAAAAFAEADAA